ncbi:hypothetical protein JG687_00016849 [Phytophthora cactorum]|uniref:Uncharacterized protein n=1 Tax=Phytophthora cactorum TaxID=29920 RepID=A0A8T1TSS7_9STRA|nr:hypothetical protein JG687_00016849 [Phytophthora cactorum]
MSQNSFGASVVLCASATGQKLLPFVVFAWKRGGPVHQEQMNNRNYCEGAILTVQKKAYCDEERMIEWIKEVCISMFLIFFSSFLILLFVSVLFRCGNQVSLLLGCCYWTR